MKLDLNDPASIAADIQHLRRVLDVDFDRGIVRWMHIDQSGRCVKWPEYWNKRYAGQEVGGRCAASGYWQMLITIDGHRRKLWRHRVVFAVANGYWPAEIDHIDRDRANDSLANLRECTKSQNSCNKPKKAGCISRMKGVSRCRKTGKWVSQININRRHINLGRFDTEAQAGVAYAAAAKRLHGEFACV